MKYFSTALVFSTLSPFAHAASESTGPWSWLTYALRDPATNVVLAALVIFLLIVWRMGAFKMVGSKLDERAQAISDELEEAKNLREQAAEALALAERRQKDADKEADAIIAQANEDAKLMMEEARRELAERLKRREAMAEARIARAEAEASEDVRRAAADAATEAARQLLLDDTSIDQFELAAKEIEKAL